MATATNPAAARVVALVMERLGITRAAELARVLEMPAYSEGSLSMVRKWIRGEHGPSFENTMAMLSKAGLLVAEADAAWRGALPTSAAEAAAQAAEAARAAHERTRPGQDEPAPAPRGRESA